MRFSELINKFYESVNDILYRSKRHMDEMVLLKLFDSYCKPLLCYALDAVSFTDSECARLANAWNSIYWKLSKASDNLLKWYFEVHKSTAISCICCYKQYSFLTKLVYSGNAVLDELFGIFGEHQWELLCVKYGVPHVHPSILFVHKTHNEKCKKMTVEQNSV